MRVLFLDIDGVLNSDETEVRMSCCSEYVGLEDRYIERLQRIVQSTGCTLILSSAQRIGFTSAENSMSRKILNEIIDRLSRFNIALSGYVPDLKDTPREEEILLWLKENRSQVESFCVLDDKIDPQCPLKARLVQPSMVKGLTDEDADKAIRFLKAPVSEDEI